MSEVEASVDSESVDETKKYTASGLIGWVSGAMITSTALWMVTVGILPFVFMTLAAVVTFPPLRKRTISRYNIELSRGLVVLLSVSLIILAGASM